MPITANDPSRKSWLEVSNESDFPIQNIPFGVFLTRENVVTVGTRIGNYAIDLGALQQLNYFDDIELTDDMFMQDTLNDFISDGQKTWRLVRNRIADIFDAENPKLRDNANHRKVVIFNINEVEMQLPVLIGDYTDFYSSKEHATNV
jgi:fumarylacetoacetase